MNRSLETASPLSVPFATPPLSAERGLRLMRASADLWRVVDVSGRAIGHLQVVPHPLGLRYRALRYHVPAGRLRAVGDFWSPDDAAQCLRSR